MAGFVKIRIDFLEQIFLRDFSLVEILILFMLYRLADGCNKGKVKIASIFLFKKDFEACGISEQSAINTLKKLTTSSVIYELTTNLTLKGAPTPVYCYAINFNYYTWNVAYSNVNNLQEKLNGVVSLNLGLKNFQIIKINNLKRCKNCITILNSSSIFCNFLNISREIVSNKKFDINNHFPITKANNKKSILLGYENVLYYAFYETLLNKFRFGIVDFALFVLDMQLIYGIKTLSNKMIEQEFLSTIYKIEDNLSQLFCYWIDNVADNSQKEYFQSKLSQDISELLEIYKPNDEE